MNSRMLGTATGGAPRPTSQAPVLRRRSRRRGAVQVEFALLLLPLLGLVFFILDTGWVVFIQSTIQEAVREGVRVGITAIASGSCSTVTCTVQNTVQSASFGFVKASSVQVTYYSTTSGTLTQVSGAGADVGGNIIQVTVSGLTVKSMGAILRTATPISLAATASDVIESNPSPSSP
jgi:Flp pilus assembly protein TadG